MQKKTHLAFGLFFFSICFMFGLPLGYAFLVGFFAFLPDIDWLMDKLWFKKESLPKRIWCRLFKSRSMHRTLLHNVWALLFFVILLGYFSSFNPLVVFSAFIGYFSHLLLDSFTRSGIYWLWPYGDEKILGRKKFYKNGTFVTGSLQEKSVFSILVIAGGALLGLGLYKQDLIQTKDPIKALITVLFMIIVGIVLLQKFVKSLSYFTSGIFRRFR